MPQARARLLERLAGGTPEELIAAAGPFIGAQPAEDIAARATALLEDAGTPPILAPEAALLYDLLTLEAPARGGLVAPARHHPLPAGHRAGGGPLCHATGA